MARGPSRDRREVWLVLLKRRRVKYRRSLSKACRTLCFGWIDGMRADRRRSHGALHAAQAGKCVRHLNKARVERLIAAGRMRPEGLALVEEAKRRGEWDRADGVRT